MNRIALFGFLTQDVDLRYTPSGHAVANFGMAINRRYRQDDEVKQEATFVDLTAFGRPAEVADEYFTKGCPALIEGRLGYRSWETEDEADKTIAALIGF